MCYSLAGSWHETQRFAAMVRAAFSAVLFLDCNNFVFQLFVLATATCGMNYEPLLN
jgi:uncharacterized YccA/Bax inhibitor family protein